MKNQTDIELFLKKLTNPQNHEGLYKFLSDLLLSKGENYYFFQDNVQQLLIALEGKGVCISAIHPLEENPDGAIYISINKFIVQHDGSSLYNSIDLFKKETTYYDISVGTFNLTLTAGNPVNLAAVRSEVIILNAGETPEKIKRTGQYRDAQIIFRNEYSKFSYRWLIQRIVNILPKNNEQILKEKIIERLENLINLAEFRMANPEMNTLTSRNAFNY
jgi:uncharacterized protein YlzI (FlbEa/FlbD family)